MFENLMPYGRQINDVSEGFGSAMGAPNYNAGGLANFTAPTIGLPVRSGEARRVLKQLLCPFFGASQKLLPVALMGVL
jgi:hypothetical protein